MQQGLEPRRRRPLDRTKVEQSETERGKRMSGSEGRKACFLPAKAGKKLPNNYSIFKRLQIDSTIFVVLVRDFSSVGSAKRLPAPLSGFWRTVSFFSEM